MIDVLNEQTLTLAQASKLLPGKPSPSTLWRWCRIGVRGVTLEYARCGKLTVTSRAALRRFVEEMTSREQERMRTAADVLSRSEPADRDLVAVERELAASGL